MADIVFSDGEIVTYFALPKIQIKDSLDDEEWQNTTHLFCDKLIFAVNAHDEAELVRYLGDLIQPGTDFFAEYPPLDLIGKYVKIQFEYDDPANNIVWVGYIVSAAKQRSAVKGAAPGDHVLTGKEQGFRAVGLEWFLDRVQINSSIVYPTTEIQRVIPFNGGRGVALDADTRARANRSATTNADTVYAFVPADETGELWTLEQILDYLTTYYQTKNKAGNAAPTNFTLYSGDVGILTGPAPTLNPEGMTTFEVLNKLICPQRGFVWWIEYFDVDNSARIRVATIATTAITLPSTGTIDANANQASIDFDQTRDVEDVVLSDIGPRIYHQIICRGARMTGTGTFGNVDSETIDELIHDWADTPIDMAATYNHGAADTTGYGALSEAEQKKRNDAFRKAELFYRVYGAFRVSADWDGKTGDGAAATRNFLFPDFDDDGGGFTTGVTFSINGLRILNHTRLKRGWNYEDTDAIVETTPTGTEAEYMPMFAIMRVAIVESEEDKYQFVEKMGQHDFAAGELVSDKITTSYHVHAQQNTPGILLNAAGMNHACALNHWSGAEPTNSEPQVDYETLRVTCTFEADLYCESKWPDDATLPDNIALQKLVLYVGDEYRLDYLAENTIIDLENGEPVLTNGGILRDDRKRLRDIARVAYEWYQVERRPLTVQFRRITNAFDLGMLITTIGTGSTQENVNTVVSVITHDCKSGRTTIQTHDTALDLVKVT